MVRHHVPHRVDGGLVGGVLVAAADPAGGGQRGGLGDADELEGEVAIGRLALHGAIVDQRRPPPRYAPPAMTHVLAPLDVAAVRAHFPALAREVAGQPAMYLDGPGGSQVPTTVIEAVAGYLERSNANLGGAVRDLRGVGRGRRRRARGRRRLHRRAPDEIAFGPNMTTLNFLLAHAVARTLEPGDEIVVTQLDHDANVSPWLRGGARPRADGAHGAAAHGRRHARPGRAGGAPGQRPGARRRLHAGLERPRHDAPTRGASPTSRTPPARSPGRTACTTRRTAASTATRSASTCCSARRTSSSARTSASPRSATTSRAAGRPTACARPTRSRRATASRRARSRTRRWPA